MYVDIFNIPEGTILRSTKHGNVTLGKCVPNLGSFGVVYKGTLSQEGENIPVAVKFLAESDETSATDEIRRKERARFKHEIEMLEMFCGEYEPFPIIFRNGTYHGVPFYVMEYLEPVNLLTLDTDDKRFEYVDEVCGAVEVLHNKGYVHYDIKPANIMIRRGSSVDQYVLADFGSVHKVETTDSPILPSDKTISMLENGSRMYPHTPGYADPLDDRHTVNSDIYAIGQVIRDTFSEEVSPTWARIIDKCTSRNTEYRYQSVSCIIRDLNNLKRSAYSLAAADDFHIWNAQKKVVNEEQVAMTWPEFKWELASCRATLPDDDDYPEQAGVFAPDREVFIDFGRLKHRNILITTPIRMTESCLLVVRGNGRISFDLEGTGSSDGDNFSRAEMTGWDEPIYPFVILLDGASLDNRTTLGNESAQIMYMVGRYCLLNFSKREASLNAEDPQFILTGRAGYSFVRNGSQNWEKGLYGILREGTTRLFAQQKWDELDIPALLKALRQIRRSDAQGDVQKWLEDNISNILMRNLGRYDF